MHELLIFIRELTVLFVALTLKKCKLLFILIIIQ